MSRLFRLTSMALIALGMVLSPSALANTDVNVTLVISNLAYPFEEARCTIQVSQGSDGIEVLNAAVTTECIDSYDATHYPEYDDWFIDCINGRCTEFAPPYRFWAMRENCQTTDYGAGKFHADDGDELSFTYETLATFLLPAC